MTATTMATYLPEVWSKLATVVYAANRVLVPLMDHRWEPEIGVGMGDTINVPTYTELTPSDVQKRSTFGTGAALTFAAVTEAQVQILVNQMAYYAFRLPVEMSAQAMPQYVNQLTNDIGNGIALKVDSEVAGDNTNGIDAFSVATGSSDNVDITEDVLIDIETTFGNANVKSGDRYLVVSPASRGSLMKIEAFRNSLYAGAMGQMDGSKGAGYLTTILGFQVYQSNNLEAGTAGKKNGAFHREAIAFAQQKAVSVVKVLNIADGLFNETAGFNVYGFKLVKSNHGLEVDGK